MLIGYTLNLSYSQVIHNQVATTISTHLSSTIKQNNVGLHGFRSKHSCESQLISFTQEVYDNLENGNQTDIIVMDFSKAFDKVDHNKLIYKLSALGFILWQHDGSTLSYNVAPKKYE